jgi:hypothetical protein
MAAGAPTAVGAGEGDAADPFDDLEWPEVPGQLAEESAATGTEVLELFAV